MTADASLEVLLARPTGIVETYVGRARGAEFETGTKDVALTPLAKEVTGTRRRYTLREEGELTVAHGVAAVGRPLQHRPTTHLCRRP